MTRSPLTRSQAVTMWGALLVSTAAGVAEAVGASQVVRFVVSGLALAAVAAVVGQAVEQVGERLGPGPTAVLQSTLGNLPELFVGLFALRAGLVTVVQYALVGSILGNAVLVLGMAFVAGGLRHGPQRFDPSEPRLHATLLLVVVGALLVPTLAHRLHTSAAPHSAALSDACAVVLLVVYAASVPYSLRQLAHTPTPEHGGPSPEALVGPARSGRRQGAVPLEARPPWSAGVAVVVLVAASAAAAVVSDWFVAALEVATHSLGLSQAFTGLVVVAIASNAVEHAVGIRFAVRAKPEFALATTLSSPLQVALLLTPVLVLASGLIGPHPLTLVFPGLLVAALAVSTVVVVAVIYDGEYTWVEGVALIGLYIIVASAFWWG